MLATITFNIEELLYTVTVDGRPLPKEIGWGWTEIADWESNLQHLRHAGVSHLQIAGVEGVLEIDNLPMLWEPTEEVMFGPEGRP